MTKSCPMASWTSIDFSCNGYVFQGPQFELYNEMHLGSIILKHILTSLFFIVNFCSDFSFKKKKKKIRCHKCLELCSYSFMVFWNRNRIFLCDYCLETIFCSSNGKEQRGQNLFLNRAGFFQVLQYIKYVKREKTNKMDRMGMKARRVLQNIQT